jgi:citrate synthase
MTVAPPDHVKIHKGLEGVLADTTAVSLVDGEAGRLYYRGLPVESLVRRRFAEVAHLVIFGDLPDQGRLAEVEDYLWQAGHLPPEIAASVREIARHGLHPMATLQAITPLLSVEPPPIELGRTPDEEEGLVIAARLPAAIALIHAALRDHTEPAYPHSRRYGERYLQLINGRTPTAAQVEAFECMQILQLEHSFNASTFTARVVASTLAPTGSALSAAIGALHGQLHGGADQAAIEMAFEIGKPERAAAFVADSLASGRIVMGMGHREYRQVDPRAQIIKAMAAQVATEAEPRRLFDILTAVDTAFTEQTRNKRRVLRANLEFYKGVVCLSLGIPKEFFTVTFAASRTFGWLAHIVEQRQDNRLIRPAAHYVGRPPQE